MTIQGMVNYLKERGFDVEKHYYTENKHYEFTIIKNDIKHSGLYRYEPSISGSAVERRQREFLDNMIKRFKEKEIEGKNEMSVYDIIRHKILEADAVEYIKEDVLNTQNLYAIMERRIGAPPFAIEKVIFNEPATIVIWADGTKTVVKTQNGETYDPEKGLAMAISKKALGNKGNYFDTIKKWTDEYYKPSTLEELKRKMEAFAKELGLSKKANNKGEF